MDFVFRICFSRFHPDWADKCTSSFDATEWIGCQKKNHTTMKLVFFQTSISMHHKTVWALDHIHPIEIIWCGQGFQNPVCKTIFLEKPTAKSDDHFLWKLDGASTRRLIAGRCAFFLGWIARFRWSGAHKSDNDARSKSRMVTCFNPCRCLTLLSDPLKKSRKMQMPAAKASDPRPKKCWLLTHHFAVSACRTVTCVYPCQCLTLLSDPLKKSRSCPPKSPQNAGS